MTNNINNYEERSEWGKLPQQNELERCSAEGLMFGRVVRENRGRYLIAVSGNFIDAEVSGAFRYRAVMPSDYPAVGDWVSWRGEKNESGITNGIAIIEWVFSRRSCFSRKSAGIKTEEQVIAANIDVVFLVFAINGGRNFTAAGLERYLTVAWNSGAMPVVVLNKADLCSEDEREASSSDRRILCAGR